MNKKPLIPPGNAAKMQKMGGMANLPPGTAAMLKKQQVQQAQEENPDLGPTGHPLELFKTDEHGYSCSDCKRTFPMGTTLRSCRISNYDLCQDCYDKKVATIENSRSSRDDAGDDGQPAMLTEQQLQQQMMQQQQQWMQQQLLGQQQQMMAQQQAAEQEANPSTASQIPTPIPLRDNPLAAQIYVLAEHVEEAAQTASSAAAICVSFGGQSGEKPKEMETLATTAHAAAQRAAFGIQWFNSVCPPSQDQGEVSHWFECMREIVRKNHDRAQTAYLDCKKAFGDMKGLIPELRDENGKKIKVKLKCCHAYTNTGKCVKGSWCTFAHGEHEIGTPQPIISDEMKQQMMPLPKDQQACRFFAEGFCRNGDDCQYSHDPSIAKEQLNPAGRGASGQQTMPMFNMPGM
jgi:hypothetical protein